MGVYVYDDGRCYFGEYRDNSQNGNGILYYVNGEYYDGEWKDGKQNGIGTLYNKDGTIQKYGTWIDGEYQN